MRYMQIALSANLRKYIGVTIKNEYFAIINDFFDVVSFNLLTLSVEFELSRSFRIPATDTGS